MNWACFMALQKFCWLDPNWWLHLRAFLYCSSSTYLPPWRIWERKCDYFSLPLNVFPEQLQFTCSPFKSCNFLNNESHSSPDSILELLSSSSDRCNLPSETAPEPIEVNEIDFSKFEWGMRCGGTWAESTNGGKPHYILKSEIWEAFP